MKKLARHILPGMAAHSAALLASGSVMAADLPSFQAGPPPFHAVSPRVEAGPPRGTFGGLTPDPVFVGPARYDIYGYPVYGPVFAAAPGPLYASTGCPAALQPVYDSVGNFAGYSPIQLCR